MDEAVAKARDERPGGRHAVLTKDWALT